MDSTIQNVLIDLKIVTLVEPKGKLYLLNGTLAVETNSFWMPLKRFINSSNRYTICQRIKQRIIELETLFIQNHINDGWIRDEISKLIEPVKHGLNNLKETYASDSQMCVNLDLMTSRLNNISKIHLQNNPNSSFNPQNKYKKNNNNGNNIES